MQCHGTSDELKIPGLTAQVQDVGLKGLRDSFCNYHVEQIAADIKESIGRVSDSSFNANENANIPTVSYEVSFAAA